jgi:hypothetical protein
VFDFRYHVASLAAVFLALVVGIVIGVGLSGQSIVKESERVALNDRIEQLQSDVARAESRVQRERAAERFAEAAYPALMEDRLAGRRVVVVFVGPPRDALRSAVSRTIADAGGITARLRLIKVPVDGPALVDAVPADAAPDVGSIGRELGRELLSGGDTPLWDALAAQLVIERTDERTDEADTAADGVVMVRAAEPQQGDSAEFLSGLYSGLTGSVPAVWVDGLQADPAQTFRPDGFAVVRGVDATIGRVALAVLLETGAQGEYGPGTDTVVPPIPPVSPLETQSG